MGHSEPYISRQAARLLAAAGVMREPVSLRDVVSALNLEVVQTSREPFMSEAALEPIGDGYAIVLRGDTNLLAEIQYNVQSSDAAWLTDGGAPAADGWINGNCSRFDLIITDTEYQLKNRRACG